MLVDANDVGQKVGCGPDSLSKLSVIKNQQFAEYIIKRSSDKVASCIACKKI